MAGAGRDLTLLSPAGSGLNRPEGIGPVMDQMREQLAQLLYATDFPPLSALLLGILGALSPCQLTTNATPDRTAQATRPRPSLISWTPWGRGQAMTDAAFRELWRLARLDLAFLTPPSHHQTSPPPPRRVYHRPS